MGRHNLGGHTLPAGCSVHRDQGRRAARRRGRSLQREKRRGRRRVAGGGSSRGDRRGLLQRSRPGLQRTRRAAAVNSKGWQAGSSRLGFHLPVGQPAMVLRPGALDQRSNAGDRRGWVMQDPAKVQTEGRRRHGGPSGGSMRRRTAAERPSGLIAERLPPWMPCARPQPC